MQSGLPSDEDADVVNSNFEQQQGMSGLVSYSNNIIMDYICWVLLQ